MLSLQCPVFACGCTMVLELAADAIFDYAPYPDGRLRRVIERNARAWVWHCLGCGFWAPA